MKRVAQQYRDARVDDLIPHPRNPRRGDVDVIQSSIDVNGFYGAIIVQRSTRYVLAGNHRLQAAIRSGASTVPVIEVDCDDDAALRILLADNRTTDVSVYNEQLLGEILSELRGDSLDGTGFVEEDVDRMLEELAPQRRQQYRMPERRQAPIDIIYTDTYQGYCCMAVHAGLKYGLNSSKSEACRYHDRDRHRVVFVDNLWQKYDHQQHVACAERHRPKYVTTRDLLTPEQAQQMGLPEISLEETLEMAAELEELAENVILIPKYDCLDDIPEHYVLGYSVPTSHGGTPLPPEAFRGRRVHLLGGSWRSQLDYLAALGEDVVSLDNNYIINQSNFGSFVWPDGRRGMLWDLGVVDVANPSAVAAVLSFGHIVTGVRSLLGQEIESDPVVELKEESHEQDH